MRVFKIFVVLFVSVFAISSCESTLETNASLDETHMVAYSVFAPDSLWKVYVSETRSIFSTEENLSLQDAVVNITDLTGNTNIKFDYDPNGFFYSNIKPSEGHVYYMTVSHDDFGTIQSTNSVPRIENLLVNNSLQTSTDSDDFFLNLEITPSNDEERDLYYAWEIVEIDESQLDTTFFVGEDEVNFSSIVRFREFDNEGLSFIGGSDFGDSGSIQDSLQSTLLKRLHPDDETTVDPSKKVAIKFIAISQDMYKYYNSISKSNNQTQSSHTSQTEIHSNIIGGYGIFAGYKEKYIVLN